MKHKLIMSSGNMRKIVIIMLREIVIVGKFESENSET